MRCHKPANYWPLAAETCYRTFLGVKWSQVQILSAQTLSAQTLSARHCDQRAGRLPNPARVVV
jgi:hypothetical protein